mmetsp:Transcript_16928/g.49068  ORF Transcript_16928/g.49068 Transcript_16928/m.49068 type:complete len:273 (-) Transcript_16928:277-1095(-)
MLRGGDGRARNAARLLHPGRRGLRVGDELDVRRVDAAGAEVAVEGHRTVVLARVAHILRVVLRDGVPGREGVRHDAHVLVVGLQLQRLVDADAHARRLRLLLRLLHCLLLVVFGVVDKRRHLAGPGGERAKEVAVADACDLDHLRVRHWGRRAGARVGDLALFDAGGAGHVGDLVGARGRVLVLRDAEGAEEEVEHEQAKDGGEADSERGHAQPPVLWPAAAADALAEGEDAGDKAKGERHDGAGYKAGVESSLPTDHPVVVASLRLVAAGL